MQLRPLALAGQNRLLTPYLLLFLDLSGKTFAQALALRLAGAWDESKHSPTLKTTARSQATGASICAGIEATVK
jgi:hypothetical protein